MSTRKVILSGVQPSGILTIGNYLGALKNWVNLQNEYDCYFMVADLHSITVRQNPEDLKRRILEVIAMYISCGIDPNKVKLFIQSQIHEHAELSWILNCYTYMGELNRMTQFKDKSKKHEDNVNAGLYTYPVLMAADILLYQADLVPVGEDQRQHLEIARNIAERFNGIYGDTFKVPDPYITKMGAKIMSLQDPNYKMSKSDENKNAFISLLDSKDIIISKFKKAVTDSENIVRFSDEQPGIKNLISIYSLVTGKSTEDVEKEFEGQGYGKFKVAVGEVVAEELEKIQNMFNYLMKPENIETVLKPIYEQGKESVEVIAKTTIRDVKEKVGFVI